MDYIYDDLKLLIEGNGGIISSGELLKAGVNRVQLYDLLANGILSKESHGNYVLSGDEPDEYMVIQKRSDKLIYSHGTALFLLGMSDRVPHILDITVPQGDNVSRIKKTYQNTRFHYCKRELWDLGIMKINTPMGYSVRAYDPERCICDMIRDMDNVDKQVYIQALQEYFGGKCNPRKIIKYAKEFNIESKVRNYMEVLQ
ncbi:MAG: type IV toxin-antitoxin system AbiEi family antitoxin domain-containing protein [Lachnospiraceae bacterium]|nr:type IV toxin-antitoxin system AbiEi family antitoxin domain-containing protein [Lachnospiraceae bacterium]